jgi:hypothetical protein
MSSSGIMGAIVSIIGFIILIVGSCLGIGASSPIPLIASFVGLLILIAGCFVAGSGWAGVPLKTNLTPDNKWNIIITFILTVIAIFASFWFYTTGYLVGAVISIGAVGGIVHEIAQSKGTALIPGDSNTDGSKENYLGAFLGIILGGAAGLLTLSTATGTGTATLSLQVVVTAFAAGVALKGISDSAASPTKKS